MGTGSRCYEIKNENCEGKLQPQDRAPARRDNHNNKKNGWWMPFVMENDDTDITN
jgi:hypothetical protein